MGEVSVYERRDVNRGLTPGHQLGGIDCQARMMLPVARELRLRRRRTRSRQDDAGPLGRRIGGARLGEQACLTEILRQAERDARPSRDELVPGDRLADGQEIPILDCIDNGEPPASFPLLVEPRRDGVGAVAHDVVGHEADLAFGLQAQPAPQIGIGHGVERMLLHPGFA